MSTNSSLWEKFAQRVPVRDIDRVPTGSPERYRLEPTAPLTRTISAVHALARRHMRMAEAKRAIECLMHGAPAVIVEVPMVEDSAALEAELRDCQLAVTRLQAAPEEPDIRALRDAMQVTQEEFAQRFGLDVAALRNWEQGRTRPDTAARTLLRVIARDPAAVERALTAG